MSKSDVDSQSGKSVMELLIVVAVVAVLFTFAAAQFGRSGDNLGRQNIAREFKISLERARFDSVKRRPTTIADQAHVDVLSSTSFSYSTDLNQDGNLQEPAETRTVNLANRSDVTITGNGLVFPIVIRFDNHGQITTIDGNGAAVNPFFYFCNGTCTVATATPANSNIIYVSPTGTVAMMRGGDAVPTFANPSVTAVAEGVQVNPLLAVWTMVTGSPSPSPSVSPLPTPSVSPLPSPSASPLPTPSVTPTPSPSITPTPSPSITPTPSPTPAACTYGQRPTGNPPCTCVSPMWVRNNGKCQ